MRDSVVIRKPRQKPPRTKPIRRPLPRRPRFSYMENPPLTSEHKRTPNPKMEYALRKHQRKQRMEEVLKRESTMQKIGQMKPMHGDRWTRPPTSKKWRIWW